VYWVPPLNCVPDTYPEGTYISPVAVSKPKLFEFMAALVPRLPVPLPNEVGPVKPEYWSTTYDPLPSTIVTEASFGSTLSIIALEPADVNAVKFTLPVPDTTMFPPTSSMVIIKAYSFNNESKVYLPQPYLYTPNNIHINRVHWSVPKINGATTDEWSTIPINSYYDYRW